MTERESKMRGFFPFGKLRVRMTRRRGGNDEDRTSNDKVCRWGAEEEIRTGDAEEEVVGARATVEVEKQISPLR
jgi:hypothetical protein